MNHQLWDQYHGRVKSKKGAWRIGKQVISHGYDVMQDMVGKFSFMQVVVLNATGRLPTPALAQWFEACHVCLSWPDPRIWCNRIGALGGSARVSTVAATCAGVMAADSRVYGIKPMIEGVQMIQRAVQEIQQGTSVEDFVMRQVEQKGGRPHLMGYARPIVKGDERIDVMRKTEQALGFSPGLHMQTALHIERVLHERYDESMNINGHISAFVADQGFSPEDAYRIFSVQVFSGVTACYVDAADREAGTFAPLQVTDVKYQGKARRAVP
ncbi:hypothetical protein ACFOSD_06305 [Salinispirillum marinum]|uniref:Citrate synthase (unknown stereospecificity) n=2 Tax=Saccharospirillaceae TaxID=255527 RepID=A0ABV8BEN1_9GAMM